MSMRLRALFVAALFPSVAFAQPYTSIWDGAQKLDITAGSAAKVDGSGVTQPVSGTLTCNVGTVATLATAAKQDTGNTSLSSIDGKITAVNTGAVVVSSSTLPSGASTSALQSTIDGHIDGVEATLTSIDGKITAVNTGAVVVSSGSLTCNAGTNLNTSALATSANQSTEITSLQLIDDPVATTASAIPSKGMAAAGTDGTNARILKTDTSGELQIDVLTMPTTTVIAAGDVAHDTADSGNPVKVGGKARNALPAAVSNGDRTDLATDLWGRGLVTEIDPAMQIHKSVNVTTTQTGSDVWSPASGKKIAVQSFIISSYGTTGCRALLWFGLTADTTYTAGTDQLLAAFSTVPSATIKPGMVGPGGGATVFSNVADNEIHLTTDAGCSLDIEVDGYEF